MKNIKLGLSVIGSAVGVMGGIFTVALMFLLPVGLALKLVQVIFW